MAHEQWSMRTLESTQAFFDLVNGQNILPEDISPENVAISKPQVVEGEAYNTIVKIRGIDDLGYTGTVEIKYNRIDIGTLFQGKAPTIIALAQSSLYTLLPEVNRTLGLSLTEDDLIPVNIRDLDNGEEVYVPMSINPDSLSWVGTQNFLYHRTHLQLIDEAPETNLPIFKHVDDVPDGFKSVALSTWGQDFTLIAEHLQVVPNANQGRGGYVDFDGFRAALEEEFGYSAWPEVLPEDESGASTVKIYRTRYLANANTEFSHVLVQTGILANGYAGTAYFHFNSL